MNNPISKKNGVEFLSLFFKDQPLCILFTDLKQKENKALIGDIFNLVRIGLKNNESSNELFNLVVFDSDKVVLLYL